MYERHFRIIISRFANPWRVRRFENFLSRPQKRTQADFERNVAESTSMLGAGINVLQEAIDPAAARAKEVQMQMKEGRYDKKKREGKANETDEIE